MSKKKRPTTIAEPNSLVLSPSPTIRLLTQILTLCERAPGVYPGDRDLVLRQVAYRYGFRLVKRDMGD